MLDSWNDGPTKSAIVDFVDRITAGGGPDYLAPEERVAVFDNDGTLWCEKPAYIQLDFLARCLCEQVAADSSPTTREPYQAAVAGNLDWFGEAITKHYNGDDSAIKDLATAILSVFDGLTVQEHADRVNAFFAAASHPTLNRPYTRCGYVPMIELLQYLEANGFTNYIASGGGRDFMRPVTMQMYGIPPERVIGSSVGLDFRGGHLVTTTKPEFLDDGPVKPARIWGRTGRRPIVAAGNSNGDIEMLEYIAAGTGPSLPILVTHDDADREFDYVTGAEKVLDEAKSKAWTIASIRNDWKAVFA